jgi:hypothetical protein
MPQSGTGAASAPSAAGRRPDVSGHSVKRDAATWRLMDVKSDGRPFSGVRLEQ